MSWHYAWAAAKCCKSQVERHHAPESNGKIVQMTRRQLVYQMLHQQMTQHKRGLEAADSVTGSMWYGSAPCDIELSGP